MGPGRKGRDVFPSALKRCCTTASASGIPRSSRRRARTVTSLEKHHAALAHHLYQAGAAADPEKTTTYPIAAADEARAAAAFDDALRCLDQLATTTVELGMTYTWLANVGPAVPITRRVLERIAQAPAARQYPLLLINAVFTAVVGDVGNKITT